MNRRAALQTLGVISTYLPLVRIGSALEVFDLQNMLDSGMSTIDVPLGVTTIINQINWPRRTIVLRGAGMGLSILEINTPIGIRVYGTQAEPINGLTIENMTFRGPVGVDLPLELIEIGDYVNQVRLSNVELCYAKKSGLRFTAGVFGSGLIIENCYIHDILFTDQTINGGAIQGCLHRSKFTNCYFTNVGQTSLQHALYITSSSLIPIEDITIEDCIFDGFNARLSFYGGTKRRVLVTGNTFKGNLTHFYNCEYLRVTCNTFYDNVPILASPGMAFANNDIYRVNQVFEGIALSADKIQVIGNRIYKYIDHGMAFISVYGGNGSVITGNTMINCGLSDFDVRVYAGSGIMRTGNIII